MGDSDVVVCHESDFSDDDATPPPVSKELSEPADVNQAGGRRNDRRPPERRPLGDKDASSDIPSKAETSGNSVPRKDEPVIKSLNKVRGDANPESSHTHTARGREREGEERRERRADEGGGVVRGNSGGDRRVCSRQPSPASSDARGQLRRRSSREMDYERQRQRDRNRGTREREKGKDYGKDGVKENKRERQRDRDDRSRRDEPRRRSRDVYGYRGRGSLSHGEEYRTPPLPVRHTGRTHNSHRNHKRRYRHSSADEGSPTSSVSQRSTASQTVPTGRPDVRHQRHRRRVGTRGGASPSPSGSRSSQARSHSPASRGSCSSVDSDTLVASGTSARVVKVTKKAKTLSSANPSSQMTDATLAALLPANSGLSEEELEKRINEEVKKRVEIEVNLRVQQVLSDPRDETQQKIQKEFRQKLEEHMKEQRAQQEGIMKAEIEEEKRRVIDSFARAELERRHRSQQLDDIIRQNDLRIEEEQRRLAEEQAKADRERLEELVAKQKAKTKQTQMNKMHEQAKSDRTEGGAEGNERPRFSFKLMTDQ